MLLLVTARHGELCSQTATCKPITKLLTELYSTVKNAHQHLLLLLQGPIAHAALVAHVASELMQAKVSVQHAAVASAQP